MADGNYARLLPGGIGLDKLVKKTGRGGYRPGAGRPPGPAKPNAQPATLLKNCLDCAASFEAAKNRRYCAVCSARRKAIKNGGGGCVHEKPKFSNGKERKFCLQCVPRAAKTKPRKGYELKTRQTATCAAVGCEVVFTKRAEHQACCSRQCSTNEGNRLAAIRRDLIKTRECLTCKQQYVPKAGNRWKHYCTAECRKQSRRLDRGGNTHIRRARKYGCEFERVNKRKVFERDGWRCYLCGQDTPIALSGSGLPNSPELDHVVPLSKGGPHTYENTRCACRQCNHAKGARG